MLAPTAYARELMAAVSFRRAHWLRAIARLCRVESGPGRRGAAGGRAAAPAGIPVTNTDGAAFMPLQRFLVGDAPATSPQVAVDFSCHRLCQRRQPSAGARRRSRASPWSGWPPAPGADG
jgi:hypothetical protein